MEVNLTKKGYEIDGKVHARVTHVIDYVLDGGKTYALMNWAAKLTAEKFEELVAQYGLKDFVPAAARAHYKEETKKAQNRGTAVHSLVEQFCKGEDVHLEQFARWMDDYDVKVIANEFLCIHKRWKYAGTADLLVELTVDGERKRYIVDVKTSGQFKDLPMGCQLAAYYEAECVRMDIDGVAVLRLDKDGIGEYKFKDYTKDLPKYRKVFYHARMIYKLMKEGPKRGRKSVSKS